MFATYPGLTQGLICILNFINLLWGGHLACPDHATSMRLPRDQETESKRY